MAQPQNTGQYQPQHQLPQQMPQQLPPQAMQPAQTGFISQPMPFQPQQQPLYDPANAAGNPFGLSQQPPSIQINPTGVPVAAFPTYNPQQTSASPLSQTGQPTFQPQFQQQLTTGTPTQIQPQSTNPFRQSVVPNFTGVSSSPFNSSVNTPLSNRASTNPFAKPITPQPSAGSTPAFMPNPPAQLSQPTGIPAHLQPQLQPLQAAPTGTNPFARNQSPLNSQQTPQPQQLAPAATGSTNPFRQSVFVNQQTGQGWQNSQQGTMGGLEQLPTIAVFPRPGQGQQPTGQPGQQGWAG
jgi:phosphatidylinositol-binding clathrin assembly protein